jgi:hypothetical protein
MVFEKHVAVKWCKISMTDPHARNSGMCKTAVRSSRSRRAFRDYRSSGTTSLRQSQFRSKSRELPHASRSTAAIMASSVSGVSTLCGLPPQLSVSWRRCYSRLDALASGWRGANCRAAAPAAPLHASIKSMSQYSTCAYSTIIRLKLTAAARRVWRMANNDLNVVRNNTCIGSYQFDGDVSLNINVRARCVIRS